MTQTINVLEYPEIVKIFWTMMQLFYKNEICFFNENTAFEQNTELLLRDYTFQGNVT